MPVRNIKKIKATKISLILIFLISSSMSTYDNSISSSGDEGKETPPTTPTNPTDGNSTLISSPTTTGCDCEGKPLEVETRILVPETKCACSFFMVAESGWSCQISIPAAKGTACKCNFNSVLGFATSCYGENVVCANPDSEYCQNPDRSFLSCLQGRGDYCWRHYERQTTSDQQGCECSYHQPNGWYRSGGCKIVNKAPKHHACRCHYQGFFTCWGIVELCVNPNSTSCKNPDDSLESCREGRGVEGGDGMGDCSGY